MKKQVLALGLAFVSAFVFGCEEKKSAEQITAETAEQATAQAEMDAQAQREAADRIVKKFEQAAAQAEEAERAAAELAEAEKAFKESVSCKGNVKLLESIDIERKIDNSRAYKKFEYDKQNRLIKIYSCSEEDNERELNYVITITYGTDLVKVNAEEFVKKGNIIMGASDTLTLNKNGYIIKKGNYRYQYNEDGNLTRNCNGCNVASNGDYEYGDEYIYDDKKSPFSNSATPKWLIQHIVDKEVDNIYHVYSFAYKNNITHGCSISEGGCYSFQDYEYDDEGFPTKSVGMEGDNEFDRFQKITRYAYCNGNSK